MSQDNEQVKQVPLIYLLGSVPQDGVLTIHTQGPFPKMTNYPVGRYCHEAVEEIQRLDHNADLFKCQRNIARDMNKTLGRLFGEERLKNKALMELLERIRQWDALDIPDFDGAFWKQEIDAILKQEEEES